MSDLRLSDSFDTIENGKSAAPKNCIQPGCDTRIPARDIPVYLCTPHAVEVWKFMETLLGRHDFDAAKRQLRDECEAEARRRNPGTIYYLRVGELIKVGWTNDLYARLGSYGPAAVVLAHHNGTRADETELHRGFKEVRAKGREWYHPHPLILEHISNVVAEHGKPTIKRDWTTPPTGGPKPRSTVANRI